MASRIRSRKRKRSDKEEMDASDDDSPLPPLPSPPSSKRQKQYVSQDEVDSGSESSDGDFSMDISQHEPTETIISVHEATATVMGYYSPPPYEDSSDGNDDDSEDPEYDPNETETEDNIDEDYITVWGSRSSQKRSRKRPGVRTPTSQSYLRQRRQQHARETAQSRRRQQELDEEIWANKVWALKLMGDLPDDMKCEFKMSQNGLDDLDENDEKYKYADIGDMVYRCTDCGAYRFYHEKSRNFCCRDGRVLHFVATQMHKPPDKLYKYMTGTDAIDKYFQRNICSFNNAFGMSRPYIKQKHIGNGFQKFILSGKMYQTYSTLDPIRYPGNEENKLTIYTFDEQAQTNKRNQFAFLSNLIGDDYFHIIMDDLTEIMNTHNTLIKNIKTVYKEYFERRCTQYNRYPQFTIKLHNKYRPGNEEHYKNYALPSGTGADKVCALVPIMDGNTPRINHQDFLLTNTRKYENWTINEENGHHDPVVYPIFHWDGSPGYASDWVPGIYTPRTERRVTARDWYRYYLFRRDNQWNPMFYGKRLFEQWLTHQWAKIDQIEKNTLKTDKMQTVKISFLLFSKNAVNFVTLFNSKLS